LIDPTTGDAINAKGYGNILLQIPLGGDMRMYGPFTVEDGDYTFTFKQLFFRRKFILNQGSKIDFNGPVSQTNLGVDATYTVSARLYDLLTAYEQSENGPVPKNELSDAKTAQNVNVILHMNGPLQDPKLTFNLDLPDRRSIGTYAYTKLEHINQSDRELFDQVAALLLIGSFIPPEGLAGGNTAVSGAINNISQIISSGASSQLTNIVNKLLGNQDLSIDLQYKNYNLSDPTTSTDLSGNQLSLGVKKNLLKDRLIVEVGGTYDWGRPSTNTTTNFNLAGDFRVQYLLTENGNLRFNIFNTSNYDILAESNVYRRGIGISWRRSFDNFNDFFGIKPKQPDTADLKKSESGTD
jgi:hypothetical protein